MRSDSAPINNARQSVTTTVIRFVLSLVGFPNTPLMQSTKRIREVFDTWRKDETYSTSTREYLFRLTDSIGPSGTSRLQELQQCKVTKLELYKQKDNFQHEAVLAYVEHSCEQGTQSRVFLLERDSESGNPSQMAGALTPKGSKPNINPATDKISIYETPSDALKDVKRYLCYRVTFSCQQPNILDLASAAAALSIIAPSYNLTKYMCFWFANSLCRVLAHTRTYEVEEMYGSDSPRAGYYKFIPMLAQSGKHVIYEQPSSDTAAEEMERRRDVFELASVPQPRARSEAADPSSSSLTAHPKGQFIGSDVVVAYYKTFLETLEKAKTDIRASEAKRDAPLLEANARADHAKACADRAEARADYAKACADRAESRADRAEARADHAEARADQMSKEIDALRRALQATTT